MMPGGRPKRSRIEKKHFEFDDTPKRKRKPRSTKAAGFPFNQLPATVQSNTLSFLGAPDICHISQVSKSLRDLGTNDALWRNLTERTYGHLLQPESGQKTWPEKPFKLIFQDLYALEKKERWDDWDAFANLPEGQEGPVPCPVCGSGLTKADPQVKIPKEEAKEGSIQSNGTTETPIPVAEPERPTIRCKNPICGFTVSYIRCHMCHHTCDLFLIFECIGSGCFQAPTLADRTFCWACAKLCAADGPACLQTCCLKCMFKMSKGSVDPKDAVYACENCSMECQLCHDRVFFLDRAQCRKCKLVTCRKCSEAPGCGCDKLTKGRRKKVKEDSDFEEDDEVPLDETDSS